MTLVGASSLVYNRLDPSGSFGGLRFVNVQSPFRKSGAESAARELLSLESALFEAPRDIRVLLTILQGSPATDASDY